MTASAVHALTQRWPTWAGIGISVWAGLNLSDGTDLVAAGFLGHAAWDAYHHWANEAVVRSYAEACCVADTLIAIAIVIATA